MDLALILLYKRDVLDRMHMYINFSLDLCAKLVEFDCRVIFLKYENS